MINGEPVSASLFDFALYIFHNGRKLREKGSNPYFYIPKMESAMEARFWDRLSTRAEEYMVFPKESIKVTALIETLPAAFEIDEILYTMKEHIVGLNCGRWDYIFSYIKKLRAHPQFVLPDRAQVTMDKAFLAAYVNALIKTCHKRGAYAIGGMSAFIPVKNDEKANAVAFAEGKGRQGEGGQARPRRHLGRTSGTRPAGKGGLRRRHEGQQPALRQAGGRQRHKGGPAPGARGQDHRDTVSGPTSASGCSTSSRGWAAEGWSLSTT